MIEVTRSKLEQENCINLLRTEKNVTIYDIVVDAITDSGHHSLHHKVGSKT